MSRSLEEWDEARNQAVVMRRLLRQVEAIAYDWSPRFDETTDHARDVVDLVAQAMDKTNEMIGMLTHDLDDA